jgi:hypothetical protein
MIIDIKTVIKEEYVAQQLILPYVLQNEMSDK